MLKPPTNLPDALPITITWSAPEGSTGSTVEHLRLGHDWTAEEAPPIVTEPPLADPRIDPFTPGTTWEVPAELPDPVDRSWVNKIFVVPLTPARSFRCAYTNWLGEKEERLIAPRELWFGTSGYHPAPQWFLRGQDLDKCEERNFTLAGMEEVRDV